MIIEENAVIADAYPFGYPAFLISGTSSFASIAASAREEPDIPPIRVLKTIFTCPRPPYIWPVKTLQNFSILSVIPQ